MLLCAQFYDCFLNFLVPKIKPGVDIGAESVNILDHIIKGFVGGVVNVKIFLLKFEDNFTHGMKDVFQHDKSYNHFKFLEAGKDSLRLSFGFTFPGPVLLDEV